MNEDKARVVTWFEDHGHLKLLNNDSKLLEDLVALLQVVRAAEREACAALLGNQVIPLLGEGNHSEAQIVAREAQRIRGLYPPKPT